MRFTLIMLFVLLGHGYCIAQCTQKWVQIGLDKKDTTTVQMESWGFNVGDIKIENRFVDSLINFLESKEKRNATNNVIFTNFKTFRYGTVEVLLKNTSKFSADTAAQKLYNFSLSKAHNGNDWDDNGFYFFAYSKKFGVIFKHFGNADIYQKQILLEDKCHSNSTEKAELKLFFSRLSQ
ncbi:MAG: hypothetical protein IT256_06860 [Chitinophagaceae bacterium]|nr:hypothetical protein [Chitinophagaceae bacterium]